jgi:hypothetical protein
MQHVLYIAGTPSGAGAMSSFLQLLFGGNMISGTLKAAAWIMAFCVAGGLLVQSVLNG